MGTPDVVPRFRVAAAAILATAVVCAIKAGLDDVLGSQATFALLGLGILSAGWAAGAGGAFLTTILLTVVSAYLFFPPYRSFALRAPTTVLQLSVFFLEGLAISAIVGAMERARRLHYETARRLEALQALTASLAVARSADEVITILVEQTASFLGASQAILVVPNTEGELTVAGAHGNGEALVAFRQSFPADQPFPAARAYVSGDTEWVEDAATYQQRYPGLQRGEQGGGGAVIALPLVAGGTTIGAVAYHFPRPQHFSDATRTTIRGYVTQAAQAFDRTLAAAREATGRRRLEALAQVSVALAGASTIEQVAEVVVDKGTSAMGADICTLYSLSSPTGSAAGADEEEALVLIGHRGAAPEVVRGITRLTAASSNLSFDSLKSGQAIWNETPEDYLTRYPELASIQTDAPRARAFWSVPLVVEGRAIGLLGMGFYQPRRFPLDERSFVETFTGHCSQALLRAQRLEAERAARRAAERAEGSLATTLRSIGDAVIATDVAGTITFMNPVAERLTGWGAAEARGLPLRQVFRIVNEHSRQEVENPVDKVLQSGLVVGLANHTVLLGRQPGQEVAIDDSGAPIRDEAGQVQGVVLVFRDVSDKKNEEARRGFVADATTTLASSLDYQTTLVRLAELLVPRFADWSAVDVVEPGAAAPRRLAVMHVDPEKIRFAHELALRYPDPPDAPTGLRQVLRTGRSELYPEITDELVTAGAQDEEHRKLVLGLRLRSAMIVPLVARGRTLGALSLVHAESGRRYTADDLQFVEDIARRAAVVIDNAQLYASERQARLTADIANRTKDEFLASVSHELRTPLNAILGWARVMAKSPDDEKKRGRAVEVIERNALAMARLIEDLLDVSRITSGKVWLEVEPVDVMRIIQVAVDSVRPSIDAKNLQVTLPSAAGDGATAAGIPMPIPGDGGRLQQVMANLLSNAVKFTPSGGRINIAVQRANGVVQLVVEDSGKGIEREFLPHVFEPFRQADGSITRAHGGLGLGLAITRHLVQLHGGSIHADSDGPGRGAKFVVELPIDGPSAGEARRPPQSVSVTPNPIPSPSPPPTWAAALTEEQSARLRGLNVLAVDDDPDARQLLRVVLEDQGAVVRLAGNVAEAMRAIEENPPDVLLSDIGMPGEDGYALIRRVRALPNLRAAAVPAAALTAYSRAEDRQQVLQAGYAMHLSKPLEPTRLVAAVAALACGTRPGLDNG